MFLRLSRFASLALLLMAVLPICTGAQQAGAKVEATVSTFQSTSNELLYKISCSYDFLERSTVFIDNFGLVPARGRLAYFSYDSNITFRESKADRVLLVVSLLSQGVWTSVGTGPDFPDESDFSKTYRSGEWAFSPSFQMIANKVVNATFPSGYRAYTANNINYMQTTYTPLEGLPPNLIGQIAMLISHPYDSRNKQFEYRIQFVVREKRIQSGKWNVQIGEDTRKSSLQS